MTDSYFVERILSMIRFVGVELNKDQADYLKRHLDTVFSEFVEMGESGRGFWRNAKYDPNGLCLHCGGEIAIRNPTGLCDHLYYPENCDVCNINNIKPYLSEADLKISETINKNMNESLRKIIEDSSNNKISKPGDSDR